MRMLHGRQWGQQNVDQQNVQPIPFSPEEKNRNMPLTRLIILLKIVILPTIVDQPIKLSNVVKFLNSGSHRTDIQFVF